MEHNFKVNIEGLYDKKTKEVSKVNITVLGYLKPQLMTVGALIEFISNESDMSIADIIGEITRYAYISKWTGFDD